MKKQLLALALVAGIGTATWSAEGHAIEPTAQVGYVVGYVVGRSHVWGLFGAYIGSYSGAAVGRRVCREVPAFQTTCADVGGAIGAR